VWAQLRGIVGLRLPIERLEGKRKLSQNQPAANRRGVAEGLDRGDVADRAVGRLIPLD
jgi:transcriptional regulator